MEDKFLDTLSDECLTRLAVWCSLPVGNGPVTLCLYVILNVYVPRCSCMCFAFYLHLHKIWNLYSLAFLYFNISTQYLLLVRKYCTVLLAVVYSFNHTSISVLPSILVRHK